MSVRVVSMEGKEYLDVRNEAWVEDSQDSGQEFSYKDFLGMLHKRIRALTVE